MISENTLFSEKALWSNFKNFHEDNLKKAIEVFDRTVWNCSSAGKLECYVGYSDKSIAEFVRMYVNSHDKDEVYNVDIDYGVNDSAQLHVSWVRCVYNADFSIREEEDDIGGDPYDEFVYPGYAKSHAKEANIEEVPNNMFKYHEQPYEMFRRCDGVMYKNKV